MLEEDIKSLYDRMADMDQPPSHISIPGAGRAGRIRRTRRRAAAIAAPALAAAAVTAIGLAASVQGGGVSATHPAASLQPAPQHFSPLRPYARFGWLPPKTNTGPAGNDVEISQNEMSLGNPTGAFLGLYAAGFCHVTEHVLACPSAGKLRLGLRVAEVDGRPAYWTAPPQAFSPLPLTARSAGVLAWQYAADGWAVLGYVAAGHPPAINDAVKIAQHVQFGYQGEPAIRFPVQLTNVPANWQVSCDTTRLTGHVMYADSYDVSAGRDMDTECGDEKPRNVPTFDAGPGAKNACAGLIYANPRPEVIDGYQVVLGSEKDWPNQELCAANAAGTFVWIATGPHPALSPASIFAHHLRLLGPDPAKWTTKPIA